MIKYLRDILCSELYLAAETSCKRAEIYVWFYAIICDRNRLPFRTLMALREGKWTYLVTQYVITVISGILNS